MSDRDVLSDYAPATDVLPADPPAFSKPWAVAAFAVGIGAVIDTLALHQPPGLGLALGLTVGVAVAASLGVLLDRPTPAGTLWLAGAGVILAAMVAVRTSPVLIALNVGAAVVVIAVLAQMQRSPKLGEWTITRYLSQPAATVADMAFGAGQFIGTDLRWGLEERDPSRIRAVWKGVLIGAPIIVVFAGLFASADAVFSDRLDALTRSVFLGGLFWRTLLSVVLAGAVAGLWRTMRDPDPFESVLADRRRLDRTTGVTVLALVVALFLFFVLTQVVGHNPELLRDRDYSENARQGFFQLVAVAFLVLNLLLALDWLTSDGSERRSPALDRLAVALIALTGLVMVSAVSRMRLYVDEFGLTELRLYTTAFMFWLAFVLAWFIGTILRNRRGLFALGLLLSALAFIFGLNLANPDALIVSANWQRHLDGADFSDRYSSELSLDSVPALVAIHEASRTGRWCFLDRRLAAERSRLAEYRAEHGLLADSWAARQARQLLEPLDLGAPDEYDCNDAG